MAERPAARIPSADPAGTSPDPEQATAVLIQRHDVVVTQRRRICGIAEVACEAAACAVEQVQPSCSAYPQMPCTVFQNRAHVRVTQAVRAFRRCRIARKDAAGGVVASQACVVRADPNCATGVDIQRGDLIGAWRVRRTRVVAKNLQALRLRQPEVQPLVRADPDASRAIFGQRCDDVAAQRVRTRRIVAQHLKPPRTLRPDVETAPGRRHPQGAARIQQQAPRRIARQRVGARRVVAFAGELPGAGVPVPQTAIFRGDPQCAVGIARDIPDKIAGEAVSVAAFVRMAPQRVAVEAVQAIFGCEPDRAVGVLKCRHHRVL